MALQLDLFNLFSGVCWFYLFCGFFFHKCQTNLKFILLKESEFEEGTESIALYCGNVCKIQRKYTKSIKRHIFVYI